jgi:molybdate transport system substrate-binding protein
MGRLLLRLLVLLGVVAASFAPAEAQSAGKGPLVLAAASLQESMNAAADRWAALGHPRPVLSFAASSALARQIEARAPADLFVSADEDWMDDVARAGLLAPRSRARLVTNALVIVAPAGSALRLYPAPGFPLARALGGGKLAMGDPDAVPAGRYGKAALERLGVWGQVQGQVARAENVRAALALVAHGAAPLGIVYATDARAEPGVSGRRVSCRQPCADHVSVARLSGSTHPDAEAFRRFLLSAQGKAIFRRFGFVAH